MLSDEELLRNIVAFRKECEDLEYTDTEAAHELFNEIGTELIRRRDAQVAYQQEFRPKVKPLIDFTPKSLQGERNGP